MTHTFKDAGYSISRDNRKIDLTYDFRKICAGSENGNIYVWDTRSTAKGATEILSFPFGSIAPPKSSSFVTYSPLGTSIFGCYDDINEFAIWG